MEELRDQIVALVHAHEARHHAGDTCADVRLSCIAYIAHCLGLKPDAAGMAALGKHMLQYDLNCPCGVKPLDVTAGCC